MLFLRDISFYLVNLENFGRTINEMFGVLVKSLFFDIVSIHYLSAKLRALSHFNNIEP